MSQADTPNIVFIFSDQQRWDTMGCYDQPLTVTPNLDAMAAEGVRFENAFTCQPVCGPARAALQSGVYPTTTGCWRNGIALPEDQPTLPKYLSKEGYEVGYIGKWHLASEKPDHEYERCAIPPARRGGYTDHWIAADLLEFTSHSYDGSMFDADMNKVEMPGDRYRVDWQTDFVLDYLKTRNGEKPFFLFVSYIEPHHQNDHDCYEGPHGSKERFKDFVVPGDLEGTEGNWRKEYPDYLGCCASLDENVGRIRDQLAEQGLLDNTLFIYTSDHGSHFRTRNSEYKRSCHEGCVRIPMIVHGPGFTGSKVVTDLVSLIDLTPTVLRAGGVADQPHMHGRALQPLADGTAQDWPEEVFLQISESQTGRAIRTKRWKYSVTVPGKEWQSAARADTYTEDFLYDLDADPHEHNNLATDPDNKAIRAELAATLKRRMVEAGEQEPVILPASG